MCDSLNSLRSYFQEQGIKKGMKQERERNTLVQKKNIQIMIEDGVPAKTIAKYLSLSEKQVNAYIQAMPVH